MARPDAERVTRLLEEVAQDAIMPHYRALDPAEINTKSGPHDVVTVADLAAEKRLTPALAALTPGAAIVGEEAATDKPELMDALRREGEAWLIDPVDGTANFAVGLPLFCVMICYVVNGDAIMSWIHDPVRGVTAVAEKGAGAWMLGTDRADGPTPKSAARRRLQTVKPPTLAHLAGAPNIRYGDRDLAARIGRQCEKIASLLVLRCAGQEYMALAEGRTHFSLYSRALPWDHAAGTLLVREAGGLARRFDGTDYRAADKPWGSPLLVASGAEQWQWLMDGLMSEG